jgi:hypothetical protein
MNTAPLNGDVADTVELFQTRYNKTTGSDSDEDIATAVRSVPCILPSGWKDRIAGPGPVYKYTKQDILEYNEMVYLHGEARAKQWADRRWHERT